MTEGASIEPAVEQARRRARGLARHNADKVAGRQPDRAEMGKVLVGRDGWLFLQNDANDVIGQHTGRVRLSAAQREGWSALIQARMKLAAELGATWLCLITPDKEAVYSELLPAGVVPADRRPVDDILEIAAEHGAPVVYPLRQLRRAKGESELPLYSPTSTHWTHVGAFVAYQVTCRRLRRAGVDVPILPPERVEWRRFKAPDDLGEKLASPLAGEGVKARIRDQRARVVFDNHVLNHGRAMVFERDDGVGPSAVVFGRSFTNYLLVFLKESFRRMVFVHTSTMPREILAAERPDVVLTYPTERFMVQVPTDASAMAQITETIMVKRELGARRPKLGWFFTGIPGMGEVRDEFELPWRIPASSPPTAD